MDAPHFPAGFSARLDQRMAAWAAIAHCTDPVDRQQAERHLCAIYRIAGLDQPEIIWADSPRAGSLAHLASHALEVVGQVKLVLDGTQTAFCAAAPDGIGAGLARRLDERSLSPQRCGELFRAMQTAFGHDPAFRQIDRADSGQGLDLYEWENEARSLWQQNGQDRIFPSRHPLWDAMRQIADDGITAALEQMGFDPASPVEDRLLPGGGHGHCIGMDGRIFAGGVLEEALAEEGLRSTSALGRELLGLQRTCPFWWFGSRHAVLGERPQVLELDDDHRLHSATGPAVRFADGFQLHYWHGRAVDADFIIRMAAVTPDLIDQEDDAELRRLMLDHYGVGRYLHAIGATVVDVDRVAVARGIPDTIPRCLLRDRQGRQFLEVTDGSTTRCYFMPVPPDVTTCREAHASLCGYDETRCVAQG